MIASERNVSKAFQFRDTDRLPVYIILIVANDVIPNISSEFNLCTSTRLDFNMNTQMHTDRIDTVAKSSVMFCCCCFFC